jgi:D-alanyl-D-alanine carboxypeptidase
MMRGVEAMAQSLRACFAGCRSAAVSAARKIAASAISRKVDRLFEPLTKRARPGAVVLVARSGRIVHKKAYGMADIRHRLPLTPETVFDVGSISKPFTALAVMLLAEEGKLNFDDRLSRFFPDFRRNASAVTLRHLLQHTAGFPDYEELLQVSGRINANYPRSTAGSPRGRELTSADVLRILARQKLRFAPGTEYEYSNSGYVLLGQVIAEVSGQSYAKFLDERIFRPLGMSRTVVRDEHRPSIPGRALSYKTRKTKYANVDYTPLNLIYGDGNINSTAQDLLSLDRVLHGNALVKPRTLAEARLPGKLPDGTETGYGFGWCLRPALGLPRIAHGGIWLGFKSLLVCFPRQQLVIILLANFAEFDREGMAFRIAKLYLGEDMTIPEPVHASAESLRSFVGVYDVCKWLKSRTEVSEDEIDPKAHFSVELRSRKLLMRHPNGDCWLLRPVAADQFLIKGNEDMRITFHRGTDRTVRGFSITNFLHQSAKKRA